MVGLLDKTLAAPTFRPAAGNARDADSNKTLDRPTGTSHIQAEYNSG
jgi:hypothetical protein